MGAENAELKTVTFTLTPAAPGKSETFMVQEASVTLAVNHGLVEAFQKASWTAYVYGTVLVTAIWISEQGNPSTRSWTVQVSPTVGS